MLAWPKAEADAENAVRGAAAKVRAMVDSGEGKAAVAARLGLSAAEVKRMLDLVSHQDPGTTEPVEEQAA